MSGATEAATGLIAAGHYILDPVTRCWRWVSARTIHRWHLWAIGHPRWHPPRVLVENLPPVCLKAGLIVGGLLPLLPALPYGGWYGGPGGYAGYSAPYGGAWYPGGAGGGYGAGGQFVAPSGSGGMLADFPGVIVPISSRPQTAPAPSEIPISPPSGPVETPEPASWAVLATALAMTLIRRKWDYA